MHYLIQENLFSERNYNTIINCIERMGLTYDIVHIVPFTNIVKQRIWKDGGTDEIITFETNHKNIFCFGSIKFAHISSEYNCIPGSMFNSNHDFEVYSKYYKTNLLNHDYQLRKLGEKLPSNLPVLFFARPCKDTKLFTGGVFMEDSYYEMVDSMKKQEFHMSKNVLEEHIMFNRLKNISYETRCWIVNGKVITMSEYRRGNKTIYNNVDNNLILKNQVQQLVDIYQPATCFVMDVCETVEEPGVIKIVEINCINSAGFYEGDLQKLIENLEECFN